MGQYNVIVAIRDYSGYVTLDTFTIWIVPSGNPSVQINNQESPCSLQYLEVQNVSFNVVVGSETGSLGILNRIECFLKNNPLVIITIPINPLQNSYNITIPINQFIDENIGNDYNGYQIQVVVIDIYGKNSMNGNSNNNVFSFNINNPFNYNDAVLTTTLLVFSPKLLASSVGDSD